MPLQNVVSIAGLKRLLRRGSGDAGRVSTTASGLPVVGYEPQWASFPLSRDTKAVQITGRLEGGSAGLEKSIIARIRLFDKNDRPIDHLLGGTRMSEAAGKYFYPLEYVQEGVFRFSIVLPPLIARLDVAMQHWRKADKTNYGAGAITVKPVDAAVNARSTLPAGSIDMAMERLREAESGVRAALRLYAERLVALPGPLYGDDDAFGEPLTEYIIHDEGLRDIAGRLAGRRLRAGRDREAIGLIGLSSEAELKKAVGYRRLAELPAVLASARPGPTLKHRSLVYLLHNSVSYDSGGYAARSHGLLRGYVAAGWEVHAFTRPGYPQDRGHDLDEVMNTIDGVHYHCLPSSVGVDSVDQPAYVREFADQIIATVKDHQIGFVQAASFFRNGLAGKMVADRLGTPFIYEMRGMEWLTRSSNDPRWLGSDQCDLMVEMELRATRSADHIFAITGALRDWLVDKGLDAERIDVLPNGCSPEVFSPRPRNEALAAELGLTGKFVAAYIGSFAAYEGVTDIIAATGRARTMAGADIRLLLVGDGQMAPEIDRFIDETGAGQYVVRTGRVQHDQIPEYYSIADLIVLARRNIELTRMISPLKPLEALSMGKAMVSTDVAAVREILDGAGVGRIVTPEAPYGLALAIAEASTIDAETAGAEAARSRAWATGQRDWSVLAAQALGVVERRFARPEAAVKGVAKRPPARPRVAATRSSVRN